MTAPPAPPLDRLSDLAARGFADPGDAIAAILDLARDLLGLSTAVVAQADGETWRARHVADAAFGLVPGQTVPLGETLCRLVGADEPVVISDAPNDPRGGRVSKAAQNGLRTYLGVPLVLRDGTLYGSLCAFDRRPSALGGEAVATLRILARLVVHELEHERQLDAVRDEEEQRFRALIQHASDVVGILAADGSQRYVSPSVEGVLGYRPDEFLGLDAARLTHPDDMAPSRVVFDDVLRHPGRSARTELRLRHRDGSWRWLETTATNLLTVPEVAGVVVNSRDVTERRRLEGALRLRDRAVAATTDAVVVVDTALPDCPIIDVNPAFERVTGYAAAEAIGRNYRFLQGPDTDPVAVAEIRRALEEGRDCTVTLLNYRKDGTPFWNELRLAPVRDVAGRVTHFVGVQTDVTQRTRAEAALREAEAKYRSLVEHAPAIVSTNAHDAASSTLYMSPQVERILGYTPEECVADPTLWLRQLHPDDRDRVLAAIARTNETGEPFAMEYRKIARDGRVVWLRDEAVLLRDEAGRPRHWQTFQVDITARRTAESALREAEATYRCLVERLPVVVYSERLLDGDPAATSRYVAPQIADLIGYSEAEWLADPGLWRRLLHPDDRPAVLAAYERAERAGEPFRGEYRLIARDGRTVWIRDEAALLRDEAGRIRTWQGIMLDITDQREAEERLREAEAKYRTLVESLPAIVSTQSMHGDASTTYVSSQVTAILGYTPDEIVAGEVAWVDLLHPDDRERVLAANARTNATREPFREEYRQRARDGRWVWLRDEAVVVSRGKDQPDSWLSVQFDVTERKRAEEAVLHSEARFRALIQNASDVVSVLAADGTIHYQSPAVMPVLGYAPEELEGQNVFAFVHSEDAPRAAAALAACLATPGGRASVEHRFRHKDGSWRDLEAIGVNLLADPAVGGVVVTCRDVTERKAADEALRRSEERFRALVQNAFDVVTVVEADGTIRYDSPSIERMLGYTPAERVGEHAFAQVHPDDLTRVRSMFRAGVDRPAGGTSAEFRARHKDGSWRDIEVSAVNLLADAAVGGILVQSRDVTERKRVETALRESEERFRDLFASARRQAQELELLGRVRAALARELDLSALFRTAVEATAAAFGYPLVSLYLLEDQVLVLQHQVGYERVLERVPIATGVIGRVARTGEPELVTDGPADPDFLLAVAGITSEVCVPLLDRGRVVGAMILESRGGVALAADDLRLMLAVAEHVGVAIGQARLYGEVRAGEARFGALVRNAPDLIMILAADGTVAYESPAVERVLGYAPGENPGANVLAFVHPADRARFGDLFAEALGNPGGNVPAEIRIRHKDGSWRVIEALGTNLLADPAVGGIVVNARDVTERRRAEEALRLSDRALGVARDGVVLVDARLPDAPMVDANPAFERISGYAKAELVGRNCRMLQGPDTDPAALASFRTAIRERRETVVTLLNYRKDGTPFWNEVYVGPVRDEAGETTHFVGIMSDVTERRRLEEQRERQVRYAALRADVGAILADVGALDELLQRCAEAIVRHLDAARAALWLLDEQTAELTLHAGAGALLPLDDPLDGAPTRVPVGAHRIGRVAQERRPSLVNDLASDRQAGDRDWAARAGLTSFAGYPLLVTGRLVGVVALFARGPLAADTLDGLAAVANLLAQGVERKRVEEALRRSEERFRAIVETTAEWIWETDAAGRFTYSNPAVASILGYRPDEILGQVWSTFLGKADRRRIEMASAAAMTAAGTRLGVVVRWPHKGGGHRDLESNRVPIRDAAGEVIGWRGADRDVTERERTAREMAIALESQRAANAELARLNRVKGDFVSVVSHEFRTPLTSIQGFSELIRDEDLPREEVKEFADDVNRNARRLARMIGDMLDLDRLQSGRMALRREPVDLNAAIREVVDTLRPTAPRHAFALDLDPALPPVPGDRDRLTQILTNLIDNAIKYAPDGGEVAVTSRREGDAAHLLVRDPGIGIPADALETVFERYARVESGPGGAIQGTGLGLPIVRDIVELHGGAVWVESEPGRGSTFHVTLPLLVGDAAAAAAGGV